jgi:hypothetical protein
MKNPELCQRPWCRERWTKTISGYESRFGGRIRKLNVCDFHAKFYEEILTQSHKWSISLYPQISISNSRTSHE